MPRLLPALLVSLSLLASTAHADPGSLTLAKTAAEPALTVRIVPAAGKTPTQVAFTTCSAEPCAPAALDVDARFDAAHAELQRFETTSGKHVVWVRIPEKSGPHAFEVLLAPGHSEPLFAGTTSPATDPNVTTERVLRRDAGGGKTLLLTSTTPAGGGICGVPSAPGPIRVWTGDKWTSAAISRLDADARTRAVALVASPAPETKARRYLQPVGGSDETFGRGAVDGDPRTAWLEARSGDGAGEYATFRIDKALAVSGLALRLAPTPSVPGYAAPRAFFVLTDAAVYRVTAAVDGESLQLKLPSAVHTSCLSVVLDEANPKVPAPRTVGIAELAARTALDDQTPEALAVRLSDPAAADEALATLLGVPGDLGVIWRKVYPALSVERRARLDAALGERGCVEATSIAVLGLGDPDKNVRERAERKLEQCRRESVPALLATLDDPHAPRAREAGRLLALLAPSVAQKELPPRLGHEATRSSFWPALGKAFRSADGDALHAALATAATPAAKLDVVLALGDRVGEAGDDARTVLQRAAAAPELATRFRAVEPAVRLGDPTALRLLTRDREPAVRHHVLATMAQRPRVATLDPTASAALGDANPRVRAAAADYFRAHSAGVGAAETALLPAAKDPWPFVRMAALRAIAGAPLPAKQRALGTLRERLADPSFDVRKAALEAMAGLPAATVRDDVMDRLDDEDEAVPVRAQAARTLGTVCSLQDLDRLTVLARATLTPMAFELEREVGLAAIEALGSIHPADLPKRLAPLRTKKAPATLKAAADRALAAPPACRPK